MIYLSLLQWQTLAIKKQTKLELDVKDLPQWISGHIQTKVSNTNKEKNATYFLGIKNVECFYLTCALLSGWCVCFAKM